MHGFTYNFVNLEIISEYMPLMLSGLVTTIVLACIIVLCGLLVGLLLAFLRALRLRILSFFIVIYADVMRALPPLMLLVLAFFGLPYLGLKMSGMLVACLILSGVLAAFTEELLWAAFQSLPKGQWEAPRSTGLSFLQTMRYIIVPQAIRMVLGPLTSRVIAACKNTALASTVGVSELLSAANEAQGYSGNASPLTVAALGYLLLLFPLVVASRRIEARKP